MMDDASMNIVPRIISYLLHLQNQLELPHGYRRVFHMQWQGCYRPINGKPIDILGQSPELVQKENGIVGRTSPCCLNMFQDVRRLPELLEWKRRIVVHKVLK